MELSIIYELRDNDVTEKDIETIMGRVKNRLCEENLDIELERLGYRKIFTVDYDDYDDNDGQSMEKMPHKLLESD